MRGLDPRIHRPFAKTFRSGWIAGSSGGNTRFALLPGNDYFLTQASPVSRSFASLSASPKPTDNSAHYHKNFPKNRPFRRNETKIFPNSRR
jgi:hypothetical protein